MTTLDDLYYGNIHQSRRGTSSVTPHPRSQKLYYIRNDPTALEGVTDGFDV